MADGFFFTMVVTPTITVHAPTFRALTVAPFAVQILFDEDATMSDRVAPFGMLSPA